MAERFVVSLEMQKIDTEINKTITKLCTFVLNANSSSEALGVAVIKTKDNMTDFQLGAFNVMTLPDDNGECCVPEKLLK